MESRKNVLSSRNTNISRATGSANFKFSPKKAFFEAGEDAPILHYEPPKLRDRINAETERKASFYKARSVFDGSPVRKSTPEPKTSGLQRSASTSGVGPTTKNPNASSPYRPDFALDRTVEKTHTQEENNTKELSRNELLSQYASKQTRLVDLQKQRELLEFEVLELEAQLQNNIGEETFMDSLYAKANTEANTLKSKVSTLFQTRPENLSLSKRASSIFSSHMDSKDAFVSLFTAKSPSPTQKSATSSNFSPGKAPSFRDSASAIFSPSSNLIPTHELKERASAIINNTVSEVREKLDQQQNEFEEFTKKGTELARNFISSLSPKKSSPRESVFADSSFFVENLGDMSIIDRSVLLSEDDSYGDAGVGDILAQSVEHISDDSAIDIDDYDSDEDKENLQG
ncbi:hypothetical protein JCM33374_g1724 [Metschnikowia sp. JCM 33374]|nr:hypothetical protein JCM33374_g1724 [Metschnikowia sp. JCM 33374]